MAIKRTWILIVCVVLAAGQVSQAAQVGTAFTYQGQLTDGGTAANGDYDLQFELYDNANGPSQVGSTITMDNVTVAGGLFTEQLDFGGGVFYGNARWLEIAVRDGASTGPYTTLGPRQELTPSPYAIYATTAGNSVNDYGRSGVSSTLYEGTAALSSKYLGKTAKAADSEKVDGYHAGTFSGQVAVSNGNLCTNLNADLLDGRHYDDLPYVDGIGSVGYIPKFTASDALANSAIFESNGKIGIGTVSPDYTLEVNGNAGFDRYLYHNSDPDTYIEFNGDQIDLYTGGVRMITADETTQDILVINENSGDVDFRVESTNDVYALFVRGSDGNVGIGTGSPDSDLHVAGDVKIDGNVQMTGSTSGVMFSIDDSLSGTCLKATVAGAGKGLHGVAGAGGSGVYGEATGAGVGIYGYVAGTAIGVKGLCTGNGVGGRFESASTVSGNPALIAYNSSGNSYPGLIVYGTSQFNGYATFSAGKSGYVVDICKSDDNGPLEQGDVVVVTGVSDAVVGQVPVMNVARARRADCTAMVGVVDSRYIVKENRNICGPVEKGQYLAVVTLGAYKSIKVDASAAPIKVGDLLTTSSTPGHAARAVDPKIGSVIGKALEPLSSGTGVIKVFVTLK